VRLLFGALLSLAVAAAIGLGSTWFAVTRGTAFGAVTFGAWKAWPKTGSTDIDPYAHAAIARTGQLPIGLGDGVAFVAKSDDHGQPLDGRCDVLVEGTTPQARFWTMTLYTPDGRLVANTVKRQGFTSEEIVRKSDGSFKITIAPRARPGNWLPTGGIERYLLVMRLYDTQIAVATPAEHEALMPAVSRGACR